MTAEALARELYEHFGSTPSQSMPPARPLSHFRAVQIAGHLTAVGWRKIDPTDDALVERIAEAAGTGTMSTRAVFRALVEDQP